MTVHELIASLQNMPPDAKVWVEYDSMLDSLIGLRCYEGDIIIFHDESYESSYVDWPEIVRYRRGLGD